VLAGCQSLGKTSDTIPSSSLGISPSYEPGKQPVYSFYSYTVGNNNVKITGVNDDKGAPGSASSGAPGIHIVGDYYGASTKYSGFTAAGYETASGGSEFGGHTPDPVNTPSNSNIFVASFNDIQSNSKYFSVGYSPPFGSGCTAGTSNFCGVLYDPEPTTGSGSHIYEITDPKGTGTGSCAATYLQGTSADGIQVGYYTKMSGGNCVAHAFEEYSYPNTGANGVPQFVDFQFPSNWVVTNSWAYGTNRLGQVVGACICTSLTTSTQQLIGWKYDDFSYVQIQIPTAISTQALAINGNGQVAGTYSVNVAVSNGFVGGAGKYYYPVDYTDSSQKTYPTVISGFGPLEEIVGWYQGSGLTTGFIGTCQKASNGCPSQLAAAKPPPGRSQSSLSPARGSAIRQRP
jgi:hypothetical protein